MSTKKEIYVLSQMDMTDMNNFIRLQPNIDYTKALLEFKHPVAMLRIYSNPSDSKRVGIQQLIGCLNIERLGDSITKAVIYICLRCEFLNSKMFEAFMPTIDQYMTAMGFTEATVRFITKVESMPAETHYAVLKENQWVTRI